MPSCAPRRKVARASWNCCALSDRARRGAKGRGGRVNAGCPAPLRLRAARRIEAGIAIVSRVAAAIASFLCLLCFGLVVYSVLFRYLLNSPQPWVDEVAGWVVAAMVMLAVPEAQRRFEHIGVDVFTERAQGAWARALALLAVGAMALSASILLIEGRETVSFSRMVEIASNIPGVP
ncbi:MAG: TRAP transporter small permease, partial [Alphaproteobacteria bacterium]|nr:TRAP transporter small permease [Alphaproteobacteria bacterium]